jgi:hypothetical protein
MWLRGGPPTVFLGSEIGRTRREEERMQGMVRSFEETADVTEFPNGNERVIQVQGMPVGLATFHPGWRWSNDVRPMMGTERCPVLHVGYALSGRLHVELQDGSTLDIAQGDVCEIPPGHDAWVVGDEPFVLLDWGGKFRELAQPAEQSAGGAR